MKLSPSVRRVVVHAAQVVVLTLATAPVTSAEAAPPAPARAGQKVQPQVQAEQVSVRISDRKVHATVRSQAGRSVALAVAEPGAAARWSVLRQTVTRSGADGVARIVFDIAAYQDEAVKVAVVTAADAAFEQDLRATEPAEILLRDGQVFTGRDGGRVDSPAAAKGVTEVSAKGLSSVSVAPGAAKGLAVSLKAAVREPALRDKIGTPR